MKNVTGKEFDPGTPYDITGKWTEKVQHEITRDQYQKLKAKK